MILVTPFETGKISDDDSIEATPPVTDNQQQRGRAQAVPRPDLLVKPLHKLAELSCYLAQ